MRLSDSERELLYEQLKLHAAQGRLEPDELERRVALIASAETRAAAAQAMTDLPPLGAPSSQRRRVWWGRGHGDADSPAPEWHPTPERFRDPRTNRVMRVWVDSAGGRHYVADEES